MKISGIIYATIIFSCLSFISLAQIPGSGLTSDSSGPSVPGTTGNYLSVFAFLGNKALETAKEKLGFEELDVKQQESAGNKSYRVNVATKNNRFRVSKTFNASKSNF